MKLNFLYQITAASRVGGYRSQIPVLSVLNWICWTPPEKKFLGTPLPKYGIPQRGCLIMWLGRTYWNSDVFLSWELIHRNT